jgi:excisionase family DNA binding protein
MDQDKEARRLPYANYQGKQLADLHLWMTTQEAAEHSGYDVKHVRRLARQGKTGAVRNGRDWWIDEILPGELGVGVSGRVAVRWKRNASGW